jgi:hypothetical protein
MTTAILPRLLTCNTVADWLNLSVRAVKGMARRKEIPCVQLPDGSVIFDEQDLASWLEAHKVDRQEDTARE